MGEATGRRGTVARAGLLPEQSHPPARDLALLSFAVLCGSTAPPLMAALAVPALAIAFWRNALALLVVWPVALLRQRHGFRAVTPRLALAVAFAATMLTVHFAGIAVGVRYTSVASASALICSQSIWAALFARALGERLPPLAWVGTAVALTGVVAVTGVDLTVSSRTLLGNALALVAGIAGGAYMVSGGVLRRRLGVHVYTALCFSGSGLLSLVLAVSLGQDLWGFSAVSWAQLVALAVLAQLLGHSLFSFVMRSVSPSFVSLGQLFTMPVSALLAAAFLGQTPPAAAVPAVGLMLLGTATVVLAQRRRRAATVPALPVGGA